ncbi:hypothetical protein OAG71_03335 [bacterium]|nr:hypothetical protein [bacterium]
MSNSSDGHRIPRVAGSCIFIGVASLGIVNTSREQGVSAVFPLTIFAAFLIISSLLIATIVYRLYIQHEVRRIKFDLVNLMLLTVLITLPFAISNALWQHFRVDQVEDLRIYKTTVLLAMTGVGGFLLFPVFLITEALLSWYNLLFRSGNR